MITHRLVRKTWMLPGVLLFQSLGCGSPSQTRPNLRVLLRVDITPATADAQDFPGGQVQFTAVGMFTEAPSPSPLSFAPPYGGGFSISDPSIAKIVSTSDPIVTVQCVAGASGTVTVTASAASNATGGPAGFPSTVSGTAQLTCP